MGIRELTDNLNGEKVRVIELTGNEARAAYNRKVNLAINAGSPDLTYVCGYRVQHSNETYEVYQVLNSAVHFTFSYTSSHPESSKLTKIRIVNQNPDYQQESLSRLEQIFEMRLRSGGRPVIMASA